MATPNHRFMTSTAQGVATIAIWVRDEPALAQRPKRTILVKQGAERHERKN
jgi:hypothetical protein